MKKIILLCSICFLLNKSEAQICNFTYLQAGNSVTFNLPLIPLIYVIDSVNWDYGDGSYLFESAPSFSNPMHTYALSGTYIPCLNFFYHQIGTTTPLFCQSCQPIIVGLVPTPCDASFTYSSSAATVSFTSTSVGPGIIINDIWDFGDGSPNSFLINPSHTYATSGLYNVCHTITGTDSLGTLFTCSYCDSINIILFGPCDASFTFAQSGNNAFFNSTSSGPGPINSHIWTFGDGSPNSNATNPIHLYAANGNYLVCHTVIGSSSTGTFTCMMCDSITIAASGSPCIANANYTHTNTGLTVNFTNTSTCIGCVSTLYSWTFGDGSPASPTTNPTHIYATSGTYSVCLKLHGTDSSGVLCKDTLCLPIVVTGPSNIQDYHLTSLNIHPNPTDGFATFSVDATLQKLSMMDISGRVIKNIDYRISPQNEVSIDLVNIKQGIYFVRAQLENKKVLIGKIIKN